MFQHLFVFTESFSTNQTELKNLNLHQLCAFKYMSSVVKMCQRYKVTKSCPRRSSIFNILASYIWLSFSALYVWCHHRFYIVYHLIVLSQQGRCVFASCLAHTFCLNAYRPESWVASNASKIIKQTHTKGKSHWPMFCSFASPSAAITDDINSSTPCEKIKSVFCCFFSLTPGRTDQRWGTVKKTGTHTRPNCDATDLLAPRPVKRRTFLLRPRTRTHTGAQVLYCGSTSEAGEEKQQQT